MSEGPSTIPQPEIVRSGASRFGDTARFHCPSGCGWWHDEPTDPGPSPVILPVGFTSEDLSSAISLNAEARGLVLHARVEQAIADHYRQEHP